MRWWFHLLYTLLIVLGGLLVLRGLVMPAYTDAHAFQRQYLEMESDTRAYWDLRTSYLTSAYSWIDYGLSLIVVGVWVPLGRRILRRGLSRFSLCMWGLILPCIEVVIYIGELYHDDHRQVFPHWADSLAIPLMSVPIIAAGVFLWVVIHVAFVFKGYEGRKGCRPVFSKTLISWYGVMLVLTVVLGGEALWYGDFWNTFSAGAWICFYLSLNAGRRVRSSKRGLRK